MNIKQWSAKDILTTSLPLPEASQLHIWLFSEEDTTTLDNVHKNLLALSTREQAHFLLKHLLSLYLHIPEQDIVFQKEKHGKPFFETFPALYFNLSHTDGCIAIAFSSTSPVGIDVEKIRQKNNFQAIARRTFLPEEAEHLKYLEGEEEQQYFFRCWTRTEAFLKGIGTGLSASFTDEKIQEEYTFWEIQNITAPEGYVCSVAYRTL
ncbi:4'-phosphopantetheinyl transferase superfamily protein [Faecalicatena contorta]|uniref:4'-phosphopantetheinyl transferase family protein n=1 Tax=Faecalicatena contorta TaxID=39482 RepID=UPI001F37668A|nr:4'-phosphopantetheinyl transferase superfamily protein [Faecalicatena contorta]MCF2681134.1 4'-phosphopantetheinyl transferase superfamily protein [Faecalicatena contorta]